MRYNAHLARSIRLVECVRFSGLRSILKSLEDWNGQLWPRVLHHKRTPALAEHTTRPGVAVLDSDFVKESFGSRLLAHGLGDTVLSVGLLAA